MIGLQWFSGVKADNMVDQVKQQALILVAIATCLPMFLIFLAKAFFPEWYDFDSSEISSSWVLFGPFFVASLAVYSALKLRLLLSWCLISLSLYGFCLGTFIITGYGMGTPAISALMINALLAAYVFEERFRYLGLLINLLFLFFLFCLDQYQTELGLVFDREPDSLRVFISEVAIHLLIGLAGAWTAVTLMRQLGLSQLLRERLSLEVKDLIKARDQLNIERARYIDLVEHAPMGIAHFDSDCRLLFCNHRFLEKFGRSMDQIIDLSVAELGIKGLIHACWQAIDGVSTTLTGTFSHPSDGSVRHYFIRVAPHGEGSSTTQSGMLLVLDETKQRDKEKLAERSEQARDRFLSLMSHELRTPLHGMLGCAELLANPSYEGAGREKALRIIKQSGSDLINLLDEILAITRIQSGAIYSKPAACKLNELTEELVKNIKQSLLSHGFHLEHLFSPAPNITVMVDQPYLLQLFQAIVKFILGEGAGGSLRLRLNQELIDQKILECEWSIIEVGVHRTLDRLNKIFEPFESPEFRGMPGKRGSGLSLTLAKALSDLLNTKLKVMDEPGLGTVYTLKMSLRALQFNFPDKQKNQEDRGETQRN